MKSYHLTIFICVVLLSCGSSCGKDKDIWEEVYFEFVLPISATPGVDTVSVGQELTITCNFSDSVFDYLSRKKYYLPDFYWNTFVMIHKLTDSSKRINSQTPAISKFEIVNITGGLTNVSNSYADFTKVYERGEYHFQTKIKPKEKGVYNIRLIYDTGNKGITKLPQTFAPNEPGKKRFPVMNKVRYTFNEGRTHYEIYKQNCLPANQSDPSIWLESESTYTFVVK